MSRTAITIIAIFILVGVFVVARMIDRPGDGPETPQSVRLLPIPAEDPARPKDSQYAIVFVHGLSGHPLDTFKREAAGKSWFDVIGGDSRPFPNDAPELSRFALYSIDYRSVFQSKSTVAEAAKQVANVIINTPVENGQSILQKYDYIWFVTHSLGGVITKRILIDLRKRNRDLALNRIGGVFLLGVPSQGAPLAGLAASDAAKILRLLFGVEYGVVDDLAPGKAAAFIQTTEDDWKDLVDSRRDKFFVFCAYETKAEREVMRIVERLYAVTACTGLAQPFAHTHTGLAKPDEGGHEIHVWMRAKLGFAFDVLKKSNNYEHRAGNRPFGKIISDVLSGKSYREPGTGVTATPHEIEFTAGALERANQLGLKRTMYRGHTAADYVSDFAKKNDCIRPVFQDRAKRNIQIDIVPELSACGTRGPDIKFVCKSTDC